jgi:tetratricopeptide (TPR) repeat protein
MMPSIDSHAVESIFLAVLDMRGEERTDALARMCDGNDILRQEVESLLRFHQQSAAGALDRSPLLSLSAGLVESLDETTLPPKPSAAGFTLQSVLGSGGMGVVYVAQQHRPRRTVALKVIRPTSAQGALLRRFEHEAELLARLQHPGIAQVYETGVADFGHGQQPFIAMELVRGLNLLEYAQQHDLSVRERLELVAVVCDAVQHAHQQGVIHRDLKPANILVAPSGDGVKSAFQPKILDFGVARATDSDLALSMKTSAGQLIGTLPYMSPEQVAADPDAVDTRSDVYALGVILYQVLAERLPHDLGGKPIVEAARVIRDETPPALGSFDSMFRGDIETIAARAMEKHKECRYASASELAADLRRHLHDEPIVARPATALYAMRKFAARHKVPVGAAAIIAIMFAAAFYLVNQARIDAQQERDRAVLAKDDAEHAREDQSHQRAEAQKEARLAGLAIEFMSNDLLAQASPRLQPKRDITLREVLDRAPAIIEKRFAGEPEAEAYIQYMLGATYESLGELTIGEKHLRRSLQLRFEHLGEGDELTLNTQMHLGMTLLELGQYPETEKILVEAGRLAEQYHGSEHALTLRAQQSLGNLYRYQGRLGEAAAIYERLLDINKRAHGMEHAATIGALEWTGEIHQMRGRYDLAEPIMRQTVSLAEKVFGPSAQRTLTYTQNLAMLLRVQRKLDEALKLALYAHTTSLTALGADHEETLHAANALALVYADTGALGESERVLREALDVARASRGAAHVDTITLLDALGGCLMRQDKFAEAKPLLQDAFDGRVKLLGEEHIDTLYGMDMLACAMVKSDAKQDGIALEQRCVETCKRIFAEGHPLTLMALRNLGVFHYEVGDYRRAEEAHGECVRQHRAHMAEGFLGTGWALVQHAECLGLLRRFDEAIAELTEAYEIFQSAGPQGRGGSQRAASNLASICKVLNRQAEAAEWDGKARTIK